MIKKNRLKNFADELIKRKRLIRSVQFLLFISFISLSAGIVLALPLRYFLGLSVSLPLTLILLIILLSFIYGFLGIEKPLDVLRETDFKMSLNEKLSAAYQFGKSANPYSSLLLRESEEIIERLDIHKVFFVKFSRRDPFQPLLLALFFFLWMSSFSFLQISEDTIAAGDMLVDTAQKIDAVNSDNEDKDLKDLADEYRKLGQKIQNQFMNDQSLENDIEKLSNKLERKVEELSREGVEKDSNTLDSDDDSEVYQLYRKKEMSNDLNEILNSLMKTFSISPDMVPGGVRKAEGGISGEANEQSLLSEEKFLEEGREITEGDSTDEGETTTVEGQSEIEKGLGEKLQENLNEGKNDTLDPGASENKKDDSAEGTKKHDFSQSEEKNDEMASNETPGSNNTEEEDSDYTLLKEKKESGEFDDENIRGELQEGEQMKSFIRALPQIVDPTIEELEIIHYYKNQLENAVDKEILPESYQTVVRDYFLSIGVLNE